MVSSSSFGQESWTTPFKNLRFFTHFLKSSLFCSKKYSFLSRISKKKSIFWLEYTKKTQMRKSLIFGKKPQIIPFWKSRCFALFKTFFFLVSESFFFIQNIKKQYFLTWNFQKTQLRKISIFGQKPWIIPLGKCRFWHF